MTIFAAAEGSNPLVVVLAIVMGVSSWWLGVKTWRGEENAWIERYERDHGRYRMLRGARRQYQSYMGAGHAGLILGPGFFIGGVAETVRSALGQEQTWLPFQVVGLFAAALIVVGGLYVLVYFWPGVPDWLRPPCQRGWEIVDGEYKLVRPEANYEHPKKRPPADDRSHYDPWR